MEKPSDKIPTEPNHAVAKRINSGLSPYCSRRLASAPGEVKQADPSKGKVKELDKP